MEKEATTELKNLFYILIGALVINFGFTLVFTLLIPSFDGMAITAAFSNTLQANSYI